MKLRFGAMCALGILATGLAFGNNSGAGAAKKEPIYRRKPKGSVNFNQHIAPIVYQKCASCHRSGEVAPFTLTSYQDVKKRAKQIGIVTKSGFMPPWKAQHGFGEFLDENLLTSEQKGLFQQWAEEGTPEGAAKDRPAVPKFTNGWHEGTPDIVIGSEKEYTLAATGEDVYQCFVVPTNYSEDRYISKIEVKPGNRAVVHHVIAFLDTTGQARKLDSADPAPGYTSFGGVGFTPNGAIGGWAPGNTPFTLPDGIGMLLPKGADIVLQVHYHKSGKTEKDSTRVGVFFAKKPVEKRMRIAMVINPVFRIPPGNAKHVVSAALKLPGDVTLMGVTPHMHLLGREMTVIAEKPDGATVPLVRIPDWDFNWQMTYAFKKPIEVPMGTRLRLSATYDNSTGNPRNPSNPPKAVGWGEQTTDEMCIAFVGYVVNSEQLTKGIVAKGYPDFANFQ